MPHFRSGCFRTNKRRRGLGRDRLLTGRVNGKIRSRSIPAAKVAETKA